MEEKQIFRLCKKKYFIKLLLIVWGIMLLYFAPAVVMYGKFSSLYELVKYLRCLVGLTYIGLCLIKNNGKIRGFYFIVGIFFLSLLFSSIIGDLNFFSWINTSASIIGIYFIVDYYSKKYISEFLLCGFMYFFVLLMVNDILMIIIPGELLTVKNQLGNQSFYFLTSKNTFAMYSFPLLLLAHLCYENKVIKSNLLIISLVLSVFPIIAVHSVTSTICLCLFELAVFLSSKKTNKIFNTRFMAIIVVILSVFQLAFTYIFTNKTIQYIIVSWLKKDPTLSGRSMLFEAAHKLIGKHLMFGMGNGLDGYYYYTVAPGYDTGGIMWAHNTSLDLLTQGGLAFYMLFYVTMYFAFYKIFKKKMKMDRTSLIFACMLVTYTVMGFTERFEFRYDLHLVFALASISNIIKAGIDYKNIASNAMIIKKITL